MPTPPMVYSTSGIQLTERFEGVRLTSYQDSTGKWTIGYGHTFGVTAGMSCTLAQAVTWLMADTSIAQSDVKYYVKVALTQGEFDALVDFAFNLGRGNLNNSTLLKELNAGNYAAAAAQFDSWDRAGGQVVAGLLRRRQSETQEFNS
jgi:lysozyme